MSNCLQHVGSLVIIITIAGLQFRSSRKKPSRQLFFDQIKGMGLVTCFSLWNNGFPKLFSFALYPQRSSRGGERWKNKPKNNKRLFKLLLVAFHFQEKLNKQHRPCLTVQKAGLQWKRNADRREEGFFLSFLGIQLSPVQKRAACSPGSTLFTMYRRNKSNLKLTSSHAGNRLDQTLGEFLFRF